MTTLQVASCPRCKQALVFGEKACVHCGQTFQYGAHSPPEPTAAQIKAALAVAGAPPRPDRAGSAQAQPQASGLSQAQAALDAAVRARTQGAQQPRSPAPQGMTTTSAAMTSGEGPAASSPSAPASSVPTLAGLDTGRFNDVGDVEGQEIPGFVDSTLFKAFTPAHVDAQQVFGFDAGRFSEVGNVNAAPAPAGLEHTAREEVDAGFVNVVSGIFGSQIYDTRNVEVAPAPLDGLDASPSVQRAAKLKKVSDEELTKIVCRCGETHRLPRCPSCGTVHPARRE